MKSMTHTAFYALAAVFVARGFDRDEDGLVTIDKYTKGDKEYQRRLSSKGEEFFEVEDSDKEEPVAEVEAEAEPVAPPEGTEEPAVVEKASTKKKK